MASSSFTNLPSELIAAIGGYLDTPSLLSFQRTCRGVHQAVESNDVLKKHMTGVGKMDICIKYNKIDFILYLLKYVATTRTKRAFSAVVDSGMLFASQYGHVDLMRAFLEQGADVHMHNDTALTNVVFQGSTAGVQLLLDYGADAHANDENAAWWASINGHNDCLALLLDAQAASP